MTHTSGIWIATLSLAVGAGLTLWAQEGTEPTRHSCLLYSFESETEAQTLTREAGPRCREAAFSIGRSSTHPTDGRQALQAVFPAEGDWWGIHFPVPPDRGDWSRFAALAMDIFNPLEYALELHFAAADEEGGMIKGRKSVGVTTAVYDPIRLRPGTNSVSIPITRLRTETGDRLLNRSRMRRFALFLGQRPYRQEVVLHLDGIRLEGSAEDDDLSSVRPGALELYPTIQCCGILWRVCGDRNGNARAKVEYSKVGTAEWKVAMPLFRYVPEEVDTEASTVGGIKVIFLGALSKWGGEKQYLINQVSRNYLAGSIFGLEPETPYDVRLTLTDPDGGGETRTIRMKTRPVPTLPAQGREIHIEGGGEALRRAAALAAAGDILLVHAGEYMGPVMVEASGTSDRPIVIRSAGDGEVVVRGAAQKSDSKRWREEDDREEATDIITVRGSHIRLHGLTLHGGFIGVYLGTRRTPMRAYDVAITRCRISDVFHGIFGKGDDCYIADNRIRGDWHGGTDGEGVEVRGRGNVIAYNTISHVADGMSVYVASSDCDVHNNLLVHCGDDHLEYDFSGPNVRVWDNAFSFNSVNSVSVQPYIAGPGYLIRNVIFNRDENTLKDRYKASGLIMINNTFLAMSQGTTLPERPFARNNLFIARSGRCLYFHLEDLLRQPCTLDLDYNGYSGTIGGRGWAGADPKVAQELTRTYKEMSLADFRRRTQQEEHGITVNVEQCFRRPLPSDEDITQIANEWTGEPVPDVLLNEGSPAIDKGIVIPNVSEMFSGQAPDLGALEFGRPAPHWGVRPP